MEGRSPFSDFLEKLFDEVRKLEINIGMQENMSYISEEISKLSELKSDSDKFREKLDELIKNYKSYIPHGFEDPFLEILRNMRSLHDRLTRHEQLPEGLHPVEQMDPKRVPVGTLTYNAPTRRSRVSGYFLQCPFAFDQSPDICTNVSFPRDKSFEIPDRNLLYPPTNDGKRTGFYMEKKVISDLTTSSFSSDIIFNDTTQQTIANFQWLLNVTFNDRIAHYIRGNNLPPNCIKFFYKGGTAMKTIFNKYKKLIKKAKNVELFDKSDIFFGRSDADYSILIDTKVFNEVEYNRISNHMNRLCFDTLIEIKHTISRNLTMFCPISDINEEKLQSLLAKCNKKLSEDKLLKLEHDKLLKLEEPKLPIMDSTIKSFYAIGFNNNYFVDPKHMKEHDEIYSNIVRTRDINLVHLFDNSGKYDDFSETIEEKKRRFVMELRARNIRGDFIISACTPNDQVNNRDKIFSRVCPLPTNYYVKSGIYYYLNETNRFFQNGQLSEFDLHRLKINIILYYLTNDDKVGWLECPSELVDISIGKYGNWNSQNLDFDKIINEYTYTSLNEADNFKYNSYSLYGFIEDVLKGLFEENPLSWKANKYDKKINRLCILLFIYINSNKNFKTLEEKSKVFKIISDMFKTKEFLLLKYKDIVESNLFDKIQQDTLLQKIVKYMIQLETNTQTSEKDTQEQRDTDFSIFCDFFIKFFNTCEAEELTLDTNIDFLNKYLKYKHKYLSLQQKLSIKNK